MLESSLPAGREDSAVSRPIRTELLGEFAQFLANSLLFLWRQSLEDLLCGPDEIPSDFMLANSPMRACMLKQAEEL